MIRVNQQFYEKLIQIIPQEAIIINANMKEHTTFRVGGCVQYLIRIKEISKVVDILFLLNEYKISYFILGNGSNLLVSDMGYSGAMIQLQPDEGSISINGTRISVSAGTRLSTVANMAADYSLKGFEFAAGIPGTIGGAVYMNAGAYGGEMKDVVKSATVIDQEGHMATLSKEELEFGYRTSVLKKRRIVLLEVVMELVEGDREEIRNSMRDFVNRRRESQPLSFPSAGSTFKRPVGHYAGKLIQDSGLSGYRIGGVCVSPKHCGFIMNDQQGCASDIYELMQYVIKVVNEQQGIVLEPEVIMLGDFKET